MCAAPQQVEGIARVIKAGEEEFNLTQSALQDAKAAGTTAVRSFLTWTLLLYLLVMRLHGKKAASLTSMA